MLLAFETNSKTPDNTTADTSAHTHTFFRLDAPPTPGQALFCIRLFALFYFVLKPLAVPHLLPPPLPQPLSSPTAFFVPSHWPFRFFFAVCFFLVAHLLHFTASRPLSIGRRPSGLANPLGRLPATSAPASTLCAPLSFFSRFFSFFFFLSMTLNLAISARRSRAKRLEAAPFSCFLVYCLSFCFFFLYSLSLFLSLSLAHTFSRQQSLPRNAPGWTMCGGRICPHTMSVSLPGLSPSLHTRVLEIGFSFLFARACLRSNVFLPLHARAATKDKNSSWVVAPALTGWFT